MKLFSYTFGFDVCSLQKEDQPNPTLLYEELSVLANFSHVDVNHGGKQILVWFYEEDKDVPETLSVVGKHTGKEEPKPYFLIYEFTSIDPEKWHMFPAELNYRSSLKTGLFPKRTFVKGELVATTWFSDKSTTSPVIDVVVSYTRQAGLAIERTTTRRWYKSDSTLSTEAKITDKRYDLDITAQVTEVRKRRRNIYYAVQARTMAYMLEHLNGTTVLERLALGRAFVSRHKVALELFVDAGLPDILADIQNDDSAFLSEIADMPNLGDTLKDLILFEIDIWS